MRIDILGLSEIRWAGSGKIQKEEYTIIYSGGDNHTRGVWIMVNKNINKAVLGYWPVSDRIIMLKIQGKSSLDYIGRGETCHQKVKEQQSNWHRLDRSRDAESIR